MLQTHEVIYKNEEMGHKIIKLSCLQREQKYVNTKH